MNIVLMTDSYKPSHYKQYPSKTTKVYSHFASRGGEHPDTVMAGLQGILEENLCKPVTFDDVREAQSYYDAHLGPGVFNVTGWNHIVVDHNGFLPVSIKAVLEGTVVPTGNVLMAVENTCPDCYWLTNYLETLLVQVWYPTTVATRSRECKKVIARYMDETAGHRNGLEFKLHDFGCRGVSSPESAAIGGVAHLVNFKGTDTVPALVYARKHYGEDMAGYSIPAAEHSTITSWGSSEAQEIEAYRNMLRQYPKGLVAVVSDSYNIDNACRLWGTVLKAEVLAREGTLVVRPDSGEPTEVVPKVLGILWDGFGGTTNALGYKVLDPHVRVIQGDGVNLESIGEILEAVKQAGFSVENLAFGMGGALLQSLNRDTMKFAFKCSSVTVDGQERDVFKCPKDAPWKASRAGRLMLIKDNNGKFVTLRESDNEYPNYLVEVYRNGVLVKNAIQTLSQIRERAAIPEPRTEVITVV